ncbi:MAG TPA: cell division protein ZapA [Methylovirgula sp.]|nr:cell division protein ZapA [Methylovirgula sp.]
MAQVTVNIAGHVYRVACGEGEEAHLQSLARQIDERIETLKRNFGEIGDQRLTIMAAITFADELAEANRRIAEREVEIVNLRSDKTVLESEQDEWADRLADSIGETAARIERLARNLNGVSRG